MLDINGLSRFHPLAYLIVTVAVEALAPARYQCRSTVGMTVQTRDLLHARSVDLPALMTADTESFLWSKLVHNITMTLCTLDLLGKDMLGMQR